MRFPLGDRTKAETRELARRFGLAVADKQDSQDICFVPTGHYADIIERLRPGAAGPGDIVDLDGRVLGRHDGIIHFTVGQRRGLGIATGSPLYVVRLDAALAPRRGGPARGAADEPHPAARRQLARRRHASKRRWSGRPEVYVKVRSTRPPQPGWLRAGAGGGIEVELIGGEDGVSPGQACAFYDAAEGQARVLGGGSSPARSARRRRQADAGRRCWLRASADAAGAINGAMAGELDKVAVAKAYARWAPIYDLVFGAVFERGRKASVAAAERIGGRILEVGVGTGLSLPEYSWTNRLIGIDLSAPMLRKAKARVTRAPAHQCRRPRGHGRAASRLPDAAFDVVVAQYVITTVPDPEATLDEFARVLKPGGEIVLVNHLGAEAGLRAAFERGLRRSRAGSAGGRNSAGSGWRTGPRATAACASSNGAPCRRSGISR